MLARDDAPPTLSRRCNLDVGKRRKNVPDILRALNLQRACRGRARRDGNEGLGQRELNRREGSFLVFRNRTGGREKETDQQNNVRMRKVGANER